MSKKQDTRNTTSHMCNLDLAAITSDPERIMRDRGNLSYPATFRQAEMRSEAMQEPEVTLEATLESVTEGPPFK